MELSLCTTALGHNLYRCNRSGIVLTIKPENFPFVCGCNAVLTAIHIGFPRGTSVNPIPPLTPADLSAAAEKLDYPLALINKPSLRSKVTPWIREGMPVREPAAVAAIMQSVAFDKPCPELRGTGMCNKYGCQQQPGRFVPCKLLAMMATAKCPMKRW